MCVCSHIIIMNPTHFTVTLPVSSSIVLPFSFFLPPSLSLCDIKILIFYGKDRGLLLYIQTPEPFKNWPSPLNCLDFMNSARWRTIIVMMNLGRLGTCVDIPFPLLLVELRISDEMKCCLNLPHSFLWERDREKERNPLHCFDYPLFRRVRFQKVVFMAKGCNGALLRHGQHHLTSERRKRANATERCTQPGRKY